MEHFSHQQQLDTTGGDNKIQQLSDHVLQISNCYFSAQVALVRMTSQMVHNNPDKVNNATVEKNHQSKEDGRWDCLDMVQCSGCG